MSKYPVCHISDDKGLDYEGNIDGMQLSEELLFFFLFLNFISCSPTRVLVDVLIETLAKLSAALEM